MQQNPQNAQNINQNSNIQPNFDDIEQNNIESELEQGDNLLIPENGGTIDKNQEDEQLDNEEIVNKQLKIKTILEYKRVIGDELVAFEDKFDIDYLNSLSSDALEKLITQIEVSANCGNSASLIKPMVNHGLGLMELVGNKIGMKWQGLQNALMISKDFDRNITLIKLKYGRSIYLDPIYTLGVTILSTAMYLDQNNRLKEKIEEHGKEKLDNKIVDEFKDL
jgi:hypothetical protein